MFFESTHRAHAHYLGKGGDLKAMLAEIYGNVAKVQALLDYQPKYMISEGMDEAMD